MEAVGSRYWWTGDDHMMHTWPQVALINVWMFSMCKISVAHPLLMHSRTAKYWPLRKIVFSLWCSPKSFLGVVPPQITLQHCTAFFIAVFSFLPLVHFCVLDPSLFVLCLQPFGVDIYSFGVASELPSEFSANLQRRYTISEPSVKVPLDSIFCRFKIQQFSCHWAMYVLHCVPSRCLTVAWKWGKGIFFNVCKHDTILGNQGSSASPQLATSLVPHVQNGIGNRPLSCWGPSSFPSDDVILWVDSVMHPSFSIIRSFCATPDLLKFVENKKHKEISPQYMCILQLHKMTIYSSTEGWHLSGYTWQHLMMFHTDVLCVASLISKVHLVGVASKVS